MNRILIKILPIVFFLLSFSCKNNNQTARKPVQHQKSGVDMKSVNENRSLNKREEKYIKKLIINDSIHSYSDSGHGFWYYYIHKNNNSNTYPTVGDKVNLQYEIRDLSDNIIYSEEEIGNKTYFVDHENYFRGFREAVKLLKEDEEACFIFPSNAAYGYHGDEKKIGINIPLKVKIKILKIRKKNNYEKN